MPINPEIHRKFHIAHLELRRRYRAISLLELLRNARKLCDVIIDLSFYCYLTKDEETATHLISLSSEAKSMIEEATMHTSLIARRFKDTKDVLGLYKYAVAIEKILDAALDIAYISLSEHNPSEEIALAIRNLSEEVVVKIKANSKIPRNAAELMETYPLDIILLIRGDIKEVFYKGEIKEGDLIYLRGIKEVLNKFLKDHGYEPLKQQTVEPNLEKILLKIVYLIDLTKILLDIAHFAAIRGEKSLVKEVDEMESMIDTYHIELLEEIVKVPPTDNNITNLSLLWLITKLEEITDSIEEIAMISASDPDLLEVFKKIGEAIGERCILIEVKKETKFKEVSEKLRKYGGLILAIKKKEGWYIHSKAYLKDFDLYPSDVILLVYPNEFEEKILKEAKEI